jgi:hypothetical protein
MILFQRRLLRHPVLPHVIGDLVAALDNRARRFGIELANPPDVKIVALTPCASNSVPRISLAPDARALDGRVTIGTPLALALSTPRGGLRCRKGSARSPDLAVVSKKVVQSIRQGFLLERVWPQRRAAARTLRAGCRRSPLAILAPTRRYGRWWTQVGTKQRSLRSNQATGI